MLWREFLKEVEGIHGFIEAQKRVMGDTPALHQLTKTHATQIARRTGLTCTAEEAREFTDLVARGPWAAEEKASLGAWCSQVLLGSSPTGKTNKDVQTVSSFANYFSEADVLVLSEAENTLALKLDCVLSAERNSV